MATTESVKEGIHLKQLANVLGNFHNKIRILNSNQAAKFVQDPHLLVQNRRRSIKTHFTRDKMQDGKVYKRTDNMETDVLIKVLPGF